MDVLQNITRKRRFSNNVLGAAGAKSEDLGSRSWYGAEGPAPGSCIDAAPSFTADEDEVVAGLVTGRTAMRMKGLLRPQMLTEIQAETAQ